MNLGSPSPVLALTHEPTLDYPQHPHYPSCGVYFEVFKKVRCGLKERSKTEGLDLAPASLREFVVQLSSEKEREITKLWFGLGDGYSFSLSEIARIFKVDVATMDLFIGSIEAKLKDSGLLQQARSCRKG